MGNEKIHFLKMHGVGNDYIFVDTEFNTIPDPVKASIEWSKPHTGIGSDGLILIGRSPEADFTMRIINADGLEGQMCGNASRCVGKYVYENGDDASWYWSNKSGYHRDVKTICYMYKIQEVIPNPKNPDIQYDERPWYLKLWVNAEKIKNGNNDEYHQAHILFRHQPHEPSSDPR